MTKLDYSRISYASFEYFELGGETWKLTDDAVNKGTSSRGLWNWMTNGRETVKVFKADVNAVNPRAAVAIFNGGVEFDRQEQVVNAIADDLVNTIAGWTPARQEHFGSGDDSARDELSMIINDHYDAELTRDEIEDIVDQVVEFYAPED